MERLCDIVVRAALETRRHVVGAAPGGHHDDGDEGRGEAAPDLAAHLEPARASTAGHRNVQQDEVGEEATASRGQQAQGLRATYGRLGENKGLGQGTRGGAGEGRGGEFGKGWCG